MNLWSIANWIVTLFRDKARSWMMDGKAQLLFSLPLDWIEPKLPCLPDKETPNVFTKWWNIQILQIVSDYKRKAKIYEIWWN